VNDGFRTIHGQRTASGGQKSPRIRPPRVSGKGRNRERERERGGNRELREVLTVVGGGRWWPASEKNDAGRLVRRQGEVRRLWCNTWKLVVSLPFFGCILVPRIDGERPRRGQLSLEVMAALR
jgi:hypothetical protein